MMKKISAFICILSLLLCACGRPDGVSTIKAAVCPTIPPYLFEENGKYRGLDLELFEGFCKARGYRYTIAAYDWQGMLGAVIGAHADVAFSCISITDKRREAMDFSKAYMDNTWSLVSLKKRNILIKDLSALKKYSIGYARGMVFSNFIKHQLEPRGIYKLSDVEMYQTYNQAFADLRNEKIDMVFVDSSTAAFYKKKKIVQDSYVFTGMDPLGFAFPKGSPLRDDFDLYLTELGPEKLKAIIDKWMK